MKRLILIASSLALLGSVAAEARENRLLKCNISAARADRGVPGPAFVANVPRSMTPVSLNAVQMTDKKLRRKMVVEGLFARRTEMNTIEVTARFVNCGNEPLVLQARSSFMDKDQFPTEPTSMWKTVHVPARATGVYSEKSIGTDKVEAYLIELRSGE